MYITINQNHLPRKVGFLKLYSGHRYIYTRVKVLKTHILSCLLKTTTNRYNHLYFEFMKFYIHEKLCMKTIKSYKYIISVFNRFQ
jgi:hypothetical protein